MFDHVPSCAMPTAPDGDDVLTLNQVAARLGFHERHVRRLAKDGKIPGLLPRLTDMRGAHWRVSRAAFEAWLQRENAEQSDGDDGEAA